MQTPSRFAFCLKPEKPAAPQYRTTRKYQHRRPATPDFKQPETIRHASHEKQPQPRKADNNETKTNPDGLTMTAQTQTRQAESEGQKGRAFH